MIWLSCPTSTDLVGSALIDVCRYKARDSRGNAETRQLWNLASGSRLKDWIVIT